MSLGYIFGMALMKSCLSCKYNHDISVQASPMTWCLLRKIKLSADFSSYAFCHHWSHQDHCLKTIEGENNIVEQQLDFARELVINDL